MAEHFHIHLNDGWIKSKAGWAVRVVRPDLLEYCLGPAACLVNMGPLPRQPGRAVYATESASSLFPNLYEHLQAAVKQLDGAFVVV